MKQVPQELTDQTTPIEAQHSTIVHNFFLVFSLRRLRNKVKNHSLVVASYNSEFFRYGELPKDNWKYTLLRHSSYFKEMSRLFRPNRSVNWKYCVLDEGHIIKNGKTKVGYVLVFSCRKQTVRRPMIIPWQKKKPVETKILCIWYFPCVISLTGFKQVLLFTTEVSLMLVAWE